MPDHVHLVVYPSRSDFDLSLVLKDIKQPVARKAMRYLEQNASDWLDRVTRKRGATHRAIVLAIGWGL